jgi:hypothetical protein
MNELEFKRHLKDLAHGHHHPEEHDWNTGPSASKKAAPAKTKAAPRRAARKRSKSKTS